MKKQIITLVALAGFAMGASLAHAAVTASAGGGVVGSKHDMNVFLIGIGSVGTPKVDAEHRVCAYCHTPHHAYTTDEIVTIDWNDSLGNPQTLDYVVYAPLWSRPIPSAPMITPYVSATFNPDADGMVQDSLIGPSRLCLTCHDGQIAADSYYGQLGGTTTLGKDEINMFGSGNFAVALDHSLGNDHPIGFKYSDYQGVAPFELNLDTTEFPNAALATKKTIASVLFKDPATPGVEDFVTCASCHDVHNGTAVGNNQAGDPLTAIKGGRGYFLYATQYDSKFCTTCHAK